MRSAAPFRSRISLKRAALYTALSCVGGCHDCFSSPDPPPPEPDPNPAIASIEIIPASVTAEAGATFVVSVRAFDAAHTALPDWRATATTWTLSTTGASFVAADNVGVTVTLQADDIVATIPPIQLHASLDTRTATATIAVTPPVGAGGDWIGTEVAAGNPVMAGADGTSSTWQNDAIFSFVGTVAIPGFKSGCDGANCGEVTLFSTNHAVARITQTWKDGCDVAFFTAGGGIPALCTTPNVGTLTSQTVLDVAVWIAATPASVATINLYAATFDFPEEVSLALDHSDNVLRDMRSGMKIDRKPTADVDEISVVMDLQESMGWKCPSGSDEFSVRAQLEGAGVGGFGPNRITVVYVNQLIDPPSGGTSSDFGYNGYACEWTATDGVIVLVEAGGGDPTVIMHEIGHGIGLTHAPTDPGGVLDESNVMWNTPAAWYTGNRSRLNLGQVFRASLGRGGVRYRLAGGLACGDVIATNPCPSIKWGPQ